MAVNLLVESLNQRAAQEIRAEMGRQHLTGVKLAGFLGWRQTFTSRRLLGQVPFTLDEIEHIARVLRVPLAQLLLLPAESHAGKRRAS